MAEEVEAMNTRCSRVIQSCFACYIKTITDLCYISQPAVLKRKLYRNGSAITGEAADGKFSIELMHS